MGCNDVRPLLGAYMDGELDAAHSAKVGLHLETCEACQREVEALEAVSAVVRRAPSYSAPRSLKRKPRVSPSLQLLGGAFAGFAAALALLLLAVPFLSASRTKEELVDLHIRSLQSFHSFDVVSSDQHTVKPWFLGKTSVAPAVIDLAEDGYPLLGGRLDVVGSQAVPVMVFGLRKHFISLYALAPPMLKGADDSYDGFAIRSWTQGGVQYVAVSDVSTQDLDAFRNDYVKKSGP